MEGNSVSASASGETVTARVRNWTLHRAPPAARSTNGNRIVGSGGWKGALLSLAECDPQGYTAGMSQDVIATVLTGIGVLFGVWRLVHTEIEGVRRDLSAQITGVNTRIDNVLLADRKHS